MFAVRFSLLLLESAGQRLKPGIVDVTPDTPPAAACTVAACQHVVDAVERMERTLLARMDQLEQRLTFGAARPAHPRRPPMSLEQRILALETQLEHRLGRLERLLTVREGVDATIIS